MNQEQQFAAWIERNQDSHRPLRRREIWKATVVAVDDEGLVVDLGVKRDGFVPRSDLRALDKAYLDRLQPGDLVPVSIVDAAEFRDEVIVSPFTFIATYNAILINKALPVFADTDPATFTMDPSSIESRITVYESHEHQCRVREVIC
jgi:hypothetical protein